MADSSDTNAPAPVLDPLTASPRELMQALLPAARTEYIRAWEFLADASTPLDRRRLARKRAATIAVDHGAAIELLQVRESSFRGDDLLNARHLVEELGRHVDALNRMATISVIGLQESKTLRPEALGCGKRYRDTTKVSGDAVTASRAVSQTAAPARGRNPRESRDSNQPFKERGPKVSRDQLGSSKHDSQLADDLDPDTRAKLEAMKAALESGD